MIYIYNVGYVIYSTTTSIDWQKISSDNCSVDTYIKGVRNTTQGG